jgi:hypothetical protein
MSFPLRWLKIRFPYDTEGLNQRLDLAGEICKYQGDRKDFSVYMGVEHLDDNTYFYALYLTIDTVKAVADTGVTLPFKLETWSPLAKPDDLRLWCGEPLVPE